MNPLLPSLQVSFNTFTVPSSLSVYVALVFIPFLGWNNDGNEAISYHLPMYLARSMPFTTSIDFFAIVLGFCLWVFVGIRVSKGGGIYVIL
ncbi:hypothetical protein Hanom_Chr06g00524541 [Helianthus anomalus]